MSEGIRRLAVPFFFCISGYWYISKLISGKNVFKNTFLKVLETYVVWTIIYYTVEIPLWIMAGANFKGVIVTMVTGFFVDGTIYHFWYFIALLWSIVITTLLYRTKNVYLITILPIVTYLIGLFSLTYHIIPFTIPTVLLRIFGRGIPFFMLGGVIKKYEASSKSIGNLCIAIALWVLELIFIYLCDLSGSAVVTLTMPLVLFWLMIALIQHPKYNLVKIGEWTHKLSSWIYFSHPLIIIIFGDIMHMNMLAESFIIISIVSIVIGIIIIQNNMLVKILKLK